MAVSFEHGIGTVVSTNETNFLTKWWATGLSRMSMPHEIIQSATVSQPVSQSVIGYKNQMTEWLC